MVSITVNTCLVLQSVIMQSICLLFLLLLPHYGLQQVTYRKLSSFVPTFMVGKIPPKGQPYQIVRIIEYILPYSEKLAGRTLNGNNRAAKLEDSLEIILASTTTRKPMISMRFLVKLHQHNVIICTGALISKRLVLSSSSCFPKNPKSNDYTIQAGRKHIYRVERIIVGYEELALLVLKVASRDVAIQPIRLCNTSLKRRDNVTMYMSKKRLSFLRTQIIANGACKRSYAKDENAYITASMLCTQNTAKLQDCQTTKGDPLLHKDRLCGINIYGSHCVNGSLNGELYANVFKVKNYLQSMIKYFG